MASSTTENTCVVCWNGENLRSGSGDIRSATQSKQRLAVLDSRTVLDQHLVDRTVARSFDAGGHAQGFDCANRLTRLDVVALANRGTKDAYAGRGDRQRRGFAGRRRNAVGCRS